MEGSCGVFDDAAETLLFKLDLLVDVTFGTHPFAAPDTTGDFSHFPAVAEIRRGNGFVAVLWNEVVSSIAVVVATESTHGTLVVAWQRHRGPTTPVEGHLEAKVSFDHGVSAMLLHRDFPFFQGGGQVDDFVIHLEITTFINK